MTAPILEISNLYKNYNATNGFFSAAKNPGIPAIDRIDFTLHPGETLGLIGESGSGKTSIGMAIAKLTQIQQGEIVLFGDDITPLSERAFKPYRKNLQMIFQDLDAALNPNMKIRQIMSDIFKLHLNKPAVMPAIEKMLGNVNLELNVLEKYPSELSGGQKRRIAIANTLASKPKIIIADEPTTGLDNYTQNLILQLIKNLQKEHHISMLLISHDLQVIKESCQRVIVLYLGKIVESAPIEQLIVKPRHPYTELLWTSYEGSAKKINVTNTRTHNIRSGLHDFERPLGGCRFAPRCPTYLAKGKPAICRNIETTPALKQIKDKHWVACHFS